MPNNEATKRKEFEDLFLKNYQSLLNLGMGICGQKDFVKDCIQLFFLELWEKQIWEQNIVDPKAYLFKAFYRKLFYEIKKSRKFIGSSIEQLAESGMEFSEQDFQSLDEQTELQEKLKQAIKSLPEQQKEMVKLKFQSGFEYEEIAAFTGKSKQTIYNQIHASIKKLRAFLTQDNQPLKKN
ncbi:MAG: sigma-70 family RNA polymerase sigma factor [Bacteroidia bacterium]|nr:sigma-70 family RNA polymerase sigma factor [Bacteroidia bacterium]